MIYLITTRSIENQHKPQLVMKLKYTLKNSKGIILMITGRGRNNITNQTDIVVLSEYLNPKLGERYQSFVQQLQYALLQFCRR